MFETDIDLAVGDTLPLPWLSLTYVISAKTVPISLE